MVTMTTTRVLVSLTSSEMNDERDEAVTTTEDAVNESFSSLWSLVELVYFHSGFDTAGQTEVSATKPCRSGNEGHAWA